MAATDLGKVGIVTKGAWSSSATYEVLDAVYYNGETYIAKQSVPANTLPTNTTYWQPALTATVQVGTISNPKSIYSGSIKKTGHVVELFAEIYPINTLDDEDTIGTLSDDFKPAYRRNMAFPVLNANGSDVAGHVQVRVGADGNIVLKKMPDMIAAGNGFLAISIIWIK